MNTLTKKQRKILNKLKKSIYIDRNITYKEMAEQLGHPTTGTLSAYIRILERKGYLKRFGNKMGLGNNIKFLNRKDRAIKEALKRTEPTIKIIKDKISVIKNKEKSIKNKKEIKKIMNNLDSIKDNVAEKKAVKTELPFSPFPFSLGIQAERKVEPVDQWFKYGHNISYIILSLGVTIHLILSGLALLK